jgi:chromosomal replication initiator protein
LHSAIEGDGGPTIANIQAAICKHFTMTRNELLSERRTKEVVYPRQIAMYLCKTLTPRSLPEIGRRFGKRDHTTVLHAVRKIKDLIRRDWQVAYDVANVEAQL